MCALCKRAKVIFIRKHKRFHYFTSANIDVVIQFACECLLYECVLEMILIMINVSDCHGRKICLCACASMFAECLLKTSTVPSQHSNSVLSTKTNQHAAVPSSLFIHTAQLFAAIVCLQYKTPEFCQRNRKTTACDKHYLTTLAKHGLWLEDGL